MDNAVIHGLGVFFRRSLGRKQHKSICQGPEIIVSAVNKERNQGPGKSLEIGRYSVFVRQKYRLGVNSGPFYRIKPAKVFLIFKGALVSVVNQGVKVDRKTFPYPGRTIGNKGPQKLN